MIYRNSDLSRSITWTPELNPEAGELALKFLNGERELMRLAHVRSSSIVALTTFLTVASDRDIVVKRGIGGELLVSASDSGESLLLTGKTAEVLSSYIDEEPVSTRDRGEMTIRHRAS
ncbi:MAG TPA: hypothetical protein VGS96_03145 [Thermoanaerobaculia bacterium]|jgi:hypothetical protein|nr:hypothetical protein [Thermoanaerobaculia bacterium]